jgi:hypothetical protein
MPNVYELTGSMSNVVVDPYELVFPNVQTCLAVIGLSAATMIGAHVTIGDKGRLSQVAAKMVAAAGAPITDVYVVGPSAGYNLMVLTNAGHVRAHQCEGFIDVRARRFGGGLTFEKKPTGASDAGYMEIPHGSFV